MPNFLKCAPGAASGHAEVGLFWHFMPVLMSLNFKYNQLVFFNYLKGTITSRDKEI